MFSCFVLPTNRLPRGLLSIRLLFHLNGRISDRSIVQYSKILAVPMGCKDPGVRQTRWWVCLHDTSHDVFQRSISPHDFNISIIT